MAYNFKPDLRKRLLDVIKEELYICMAGKMITGNNGVVQMLAQDDIDGVQ